MMFFDKIYESWKEMQKIKYGATSEILRKHGIDENSLVLDVGCGKFRFDLPGRVVRTDIKYGDVLSDGGALPFRDGEFDAVVAIDSVHLFGFSELVRVAKHNGLIAAGLPENMWGKTTIPEIEPIVEFEIPTKEHEVLKLFRK